MHAFQRLMLLWLLNCHLLPRRLIKFVPVFCDAGQRSELFVRAWRFTPGQLRTALDGLSGPSLHLVFWTRIGDLLLELQPRILRVIQDNSSV